MPRRSLLCVQRLNRLRSLLGGVFLECGRGQQPIRVPGMPRRGLLYYQRFHRMHSLSCRGILGRGRG